MNRLIKNVLLVVVVLISSCTKIVFDDPHYYEIKKDSHASTPMTVSQGLRSITFKKNGHTGYPGYIEFMLDSSCYYEYVDLNSLDWNKIGGFKHNIDARDLSYRIAWRPAFDEPYVFEIAHYVYIEGQRQSIKPIARVKALQTYILRFYLNHPTFGPNTIYFPDQKHTINWRFYGKDYYQSNPWFGGDNSAPHNMTIRFNLETSEIN